MLKPNKFTKEVELKSELVISKLISTQVTWWYTQKKDTNTKETKGDSSELSGKHFRIHHKHCWGICDPIAWVTIDNFFYITVI
jgi:hypothetical protein